MKGHIFIPFISCMLLLWGCADDHTTTGGTPLSDITIDPQSVAEEYNLEKNDVLEIDPVVTQTIDGKELSYEWEVEHETYSTDRILRFECNRLGSFACRLKVSNEDGTTFRPFTINVNTPYEEGVLIVSNDPSGNSHVAFMLSRTDGEPDSFYDYDIFSINNPNENFAPNVSDAVVSSGSLILACKGDGTIPPTIYYLQEKTMDIENMVSFPEYPTFSPVRLLVTKISASGASYPVVSEDGKIYDFASTEGVVVESNKFKWTYDPRLSEFYDTETGTGYNIFLWDTENNIPSTMFNGYGGYFCVKDYDLKENQAAINSSTNIFDGESPLAMFIPRYTSRDLLRETPLVYFITASNGEVHRTSMDKGVWTYDYSTGLTTMGTREIKGAIGNESDCPLKPGVPMIASSTNKRLFFASGNTIYQWYYPQGGLSTATVFATIGNENTVIKSFDLSADQSKLYVAAADAGASGLNGSCYIAEIKQMSGTETVYAGDIAEYRNVCYDPVKILYKSK